MTALVTIGFTRKTLEQFVGLLSEHHVQKLVDIRLRPNTQLSGFARGVDLAFLLPHCFGMEYVHEPLLAPTAELLDRYRKTNDWTAYEVGFDELSRERGMVDVLARAIEDRDVVALLCSEATADRCHRRLLAERFMASNTTEVRHL